MGAVLPDLLAPGLRLVLCGSAPGQVSARAGAYYAHPQNRFWPTLADVGLTPRRFAPHEFPKLLELGIGLTDLAERGQGSDSDLGPGAYDPDALAAKIRRYRPGVLAFVGKTPAKAYLRHRFGQRTVECGMQPHAEGSTRLFVLPSPSSRARAFWTVDPWRELARRVHDADQTSRSAGNVTVTVVP